MIKNEGGNAGAAQALDLRRQNVQRYVQQPGGFTTRVHKMLEEKLAIYERRPASRWSLAAKSKPDENEQNVPIPALARDVLRYVLDAVEARQSGHGEATNA